jgi:hypothetical protein
MNSIFIEHNSGNQNEKCLTVLMIMHTDMILRMQDDFRHVHDFDDDQKTSIVTMSMILTSACSHDSQKSNHSFIPITFRQWLACMTIVIISQTLTESLSWIRTYSGSQLIQTCPKRSKQPTICTVVCNYRMTFGHIIGIIVLLLRTE